MGILRFSEFINEKGAACPKDGYQGAFGDDYIGYELPAGFKYLDTCGLADRGEVIINSLHLTDEMVIQRGYSQTSN